MSTRGRIEQRIVTVLKQDAEAALRRWRARGWVLDRSHYGEPVSGLPTVVLHLHRRAK